MNLSNFETYIDEVIIERGKNYVEQGHVISVEEMGPNIFMIDVVGTDDYTVEIAMNDANDIIGTFCNCPYDQGDYCKHEAAALFALREERKTEKGQVNKILKKKPDLKTIMSSLKKDELIEIIMNLTIENPELEKKLLFMYSNQDDEIAASKKLIKDYMKRYKHRGFIAWNDVDKALQGAYMTLEKVREKLQTGDLESAILLSTTVLSHIVDMLGYCDDSSGTPGAVIEDSLEVIQEATSIAVDTLDNPEQERLFKILLKESQRPCYQGWMDWKLSLLRGCSYLCNTSERRKMLEDQLESMLKTIGDSWNDEYETEQIKLLQLEVIERYDGEEQALQFIGENVHMSHFREKAIHFVMEKEDYTAVLTLCEEGKKVDQQYRGLVHKWETYELQAYEGLGDVNKQREYMLAFLYRNKFSYYARLKTLYSHNEWEEILPAILETFEKQSYLPDAYVEILIEEKLDGKLIEYCKRNISSIINLYPHLVKDHFDEVIEMFQRYIQTEAEQSNNRSRYRKVCSQIKLYKKVCGANHAKVLVDDLKQKYQRRPAFQDELGKIRI